MSDRAFSAAAARRARPPTPVARVESYRRLADVFHDVLGEQSLDALLDRIAGALAELVPHDSLTIYEADEPRRLLVPVWARDKWADKILRRHVPVRRRTDRLGRRASRGRARRTRRTSTRASATVSGTPPDEPEALITIPLIARDSIKGALNIYRARRRGARSTTTSSSWRSGSATPPRSRSTTRRSARGSSTRRRRIL